METLPGRRRRLGPIGRAASIVLLASGFIGCTSDGSGTNTASTADTGPSAPSAGTAGVDESTACPDLVLTEMSHGLTVGLPAGASWSTSFATDDPGPVHADAGVRLDVDGAAVEVWRSREEPPASAGRRFRLDGEWFVVVDSPDEALARCVLDSTTYDEDRDAADP